MMKRISKEIRMLLLLALPMLLVLLLHYFYTGFVVYNDGIDYYVYLRSGIIDQDLNFSNEWHYYNSSYSRFSSVPRGTNFLGIMTPLGYADNIHLIGNALMWFPFFILAHALTLLLHFFGFAIEPDGYSFLYEMSIAAATLIYGFFGILFSYKFCRRFFHSKTSFLAVAGLWYGTSAFWYYSVEPSMAHLNSLFLASLFVYFWHSTLEKRTSIQWFLLGLLLGLMYLVRQQDILFILLPGFEVLKTLFAKSGIKQIKGIIFSQLLFGAGILIMLLPQIFVWKKLYGQYIVFSYGSYASQTNLWHWAFPQLIPFFFSLQYGMLFRATWMFVALIGIFLLARRMKRIFYYFAIVVATQIIVTSAWSSWNSGYGSRFMLSAGIFFALGMAEIIELARRKAGMGWAYALLVFLIIANLASMALYLLEEVITKIPLSELPSAVLGILR